MGKIEVAGFATWRDVTGGCGWYGTTELDVMVCRPNANFDSRRALKSGV